MSGTPVIMKRTSMPLAAAVHIAVISGSSGTKYGDWIQMRSCALVSAVMNTSRMVLNVVCTLECSTWTGVPSCR